MLPGCAMIKRKAVGMVASTLASSGDVFTRDDDLELVGQAIPFGLKLYESLLDSAPKNKDLLIATCSNFTQYGVAYLETEALVLGEAKHHDEVARLNARALKMYLRARGYCLRAMEVRFPGIQPKLLTDPAAALAKARKKSDVPLLYWTAASWGSAIALGARQARARHRHADGRALADRAIALDETWSKGALHEMFISLDSVRRSDWADRRSARATHFKRAVELQGGAVARALRGARASASPCRRRTRRVRVAAEAGARRRSGEGSVDASRHARAAAPRARPARPHRHARSRSESFRK